MSQISQIIDKMDLKKPDTVQAALAEAMNDTGVKVGTKVAVLGDPTYGLDGAKATVKAINGGFADLEFENKMVAKMHVNLLIPVQ